MDRWRYATDDILMNGSLVTAGSERLSVRRCMHNVVMHTAWLFLIDKQVFFRRTCIACTPHQLQTLQAMSTVAKINVPYFAAAVIVNIMTKSRKTFKSARKPVERAAFIQSNYSSVERIVFLNKNSFELVESVTSVTVEV